jgi:hypothetical protein
MQLGILLPNFSGFPHSADDLKVPLDEMLVAVPKPLLSPLLI